MVETGAKFWSTKDPGQQPFSYQAGVGKVITGWDQGCLGMKVNTPATQPRIELGAGRRGTGAYNPGRRGLRSTRLPCLVIWRLPQRWLSSCCLAGASHQAAPSTLLSSVCKFNKLDTRLQFNSVYSRSYQYVLYNHAATIVHVHVVPYLACKLRTNDLIKPASLVHHWV